MTGAYKTNHKLNTAEELVDILNLILDKKYIVEVKKAGSGVTKFLTGNAFDEIRVKKNAYHGVSIIISGNDENLDFMTLTISEYIPNMLVGQFFGKTGLLDVIIAKLIWGDKKPFHNAVLACLVDKLSIREIDASLKEQIKMFSKGKSIFEGEGKEVKVDREEE